MPRRPDRTLTLTRTLTRTLTLTLTRLDPEGQGFRVNRPEGPTCEFAFRWDSPKRRAAAPTEAEPEEGEG